MNPLRSVGARLSFALLLVVAAALAIVYAMLVPRLEQSLVDSKLSQLVSSGQGLADRVPGDQRLWGIFVQDNAASVNARVALVIPEPPVVFPYADSSRRETDLVEDELALRAWETGNVQRGRLGEGDGAYAEAAVPVIPKGVVLVLRAPLQDTLDNVHLVQRRLLVAGLLALAFSLLAGYGLAYLFARRLRRLERAADRIAGGQFDEPVEDRGRDEVGQLAGAFDRMRMRLAGLERARREFIANASHELRTPIFALGGFLELLADEDLDEQTRHEFLGTAREQVVRLTKLATDLLDLSRIDAGRVQIERRELDFGALARSLCEEFTGVARSGRHELETEIQGTPRGVGDEQRTLQIGRILVENALVHTPQGTPVRLRAAQRNGRAELAVEDEGPGIPAGQEEQVFERFYRVDGGVAQGSGLGLAIARELAELMGGTIEVESRPGATTFRLALPSAA
ncbi:MAG TPA: HAMP domain-containing sensor histidine kinase [Gaiellaceae bacterium]|nr:HAMP domain-containing sensor histidine kinase [Gaiellaceae bacterium]